MSPTGLPLSCSAVEIKDLYDSAVYNLKLLELGQPDSVSPSHYL